MPFVDEERRNAISSVRGRVLLWWFLWGLALTAATATSSLDEEVVLQRSGQLKMDTCGSLLYLAASVVVAAFRVLFDVLDAGVLRFLQDDVEAEAVSESPKVSAGASSSPTFPLTAAARRGLRRLVVVLAVLAGNNGGGPFIILVAG